MKTTKEIIDDISYEYRLINPPSYTDWNKKWFSEDDVKKILNDEYLMEIVVSETKRAYGIRLIKLIESKFFKEN